jgi:hypothetical protein
VNDESSAPVQRCLGQVRSLFYLLDEPTTTLTIQAGAQTITAYASGQVALDLRALPRGATICVTLRDTSTYDLEIIALILIST